MEVKITTDRSTEVISSVSFPPPSAPPLYFTQAATVTATPIPPTAYTSAYVKRNNTPNIKSVSQASFIFITGGMNIAWSFGFTSLLFMPLTLHLRVCWFIGAIAGAILGAFLVNYVKRKFTMACCHVLIAISGILFVVWPENTQAILAARYINGITNGFAMVFIMVMISEQVDRSCRGMAASVTESLSFSFGMFLQELYTVLWSLWFDDSISFPPMIVLGIVCLVASIFGFFSAVFLVNESPMYFLMRNRESDALAAQRKLQHPNVASYDTFEHLEDQKRCLLESKSRTLGESAYDGLPALLKLCLYRSLVALSFSLPITFSVILSSDVVVRPLHTLWPILIFGFLRWLGSVISSFLLDNVGRKMPAMIGLLISGILSLFLGLIFNGFFDSTLVATMTAALWLLCAFQLCAGAFVCASSVYLSEAFPLAVKPYYIAIAIIIEMVIQIVICECGAVRLYIDDYFYVIFALFISFLLFMHFLLPETRRDTIREAARKFRCSSRM